MPWLKMPSHYPGLECVGLQLGPPQLTTIEDIRGGFEPRTRTDEVGAESQELERPPSYSPTTTLVAPGVLVHLQAAASATLLFNALFHSQNRFPGFPAFSRLSQ